MGIKKTKKIVKQTSKAVLDLNLSTQERIRRIVEENDTKAGQLFDVTIQILIVFSIIVYSLGTLPNLSPFWVKILNIIDITCYVIFTIEYFSRVYISKNRLKYIFSLYGIIDLLAILPFLFARQFDLRAIRALRVFRIISALKISRYNAALRRFTVALNIIKPELVLFFILTGIFIFLSAAGIYYFENEAQPEAFASIFHSLWWSIITLTTVGYGDVYPITLGGRAFTFLILLIGLGIITIPTGLIASALSAARDLDVAEKLRISEEKEKHKQDKNELIEQAITDFVKGGDNSDLELLNKVLHPDFRVTNNGFMGTAGVAIITKKEYLSKIESGVFGGLPRKMQIEEIDQNGKIASVKLRIESSENDFISYNSLVLDTDGEWKIINNLAVVKAKK